MSDSENEVKIAQRKRQRLVRLLFALPWLFVLLASVEFYAVAQRRWVERHNPWIQALKDSGRTPAVSERAPEPTEPSADCITATQNGGDSLPEWADPQASEVPEMRVQRQQQFLGLSESDRNLYALLNDEIVCEITEKGTVRGLYGNWLARMSYRVGKANLPPFDQDNLPTLDAQGRAMVKLQRDIAPGAVCVWEIALQRDSRTNRLYAFCPMDFRALTMKALPADTPWEVPFFKYKRNLRNARSSMGITFDTNNYGFRDHDVIVPKPEGTFRILCVGGSTTEEGPDNARTYPNLLEKELNQAFPDRSIEVINCGVSGMTSTAHLSRLGDYLALQPDMIILYEGVNDIHRDLCEYWRSIGASFPRRVLSLSTAVSTWADALIYPGQDELLEGVRGLTVANTQAIGRAARHHDITVAMCSIASPGATGISSDERAYYDYCARTSGLDSCLGLSRYNSILNTLNAEVKQLCTRDGSLYIPVAENMQGGRAVFSDIYHLTDAGIELKAHVIADCMKQYIQESK